MRGTDGPTSFPLAWPLGWRRSKARRRSPFKAPGLALVAKDVYRELKLLGVGDWNVVISSNVELRRDGLPYSNQRKPEDPGVAVYFRMGTEPRVLACDRWETPEENLRAVAKHIEALRGMERWGVGSLDQAFAGYAPPRSDRVCLRDRKGGDPAEWPEDLRVREFPQPMGARA